MEKSVVKFAFRFTTIGRVHHMIWVDSFFPFCSIIFPPPATLHHLPSWWCLFSYSFPLSSCCEYLWTLLDTPKWKKSASKTMPIRKSPPSPTTIRRRRNETMSYRRDTSVACWTKWAATAMLVCIVLFSLSFWELYSEEKAELSTLRSRVAVVYAGK